MTNAELLERKKRIEDLAQILHEAGREAVDRGMVYVSDPNRRPFCEWDLLPEHAREGRRIQARYLIRRRVAVGRLIQVI